VSDPTFSQNSSQAPACDNAARSEEIPQFGAVDIVEAFTAMRHEWRVQSKESRALGEQIQGAAANLLSVESCLQSLESKLLAGAGEPRPQTSVESKPLAMILVETDHQLSRAAAAIAQWEANRKRRDATDAQALEHSIAAMSRLARWFAQPLLALLANRRSVQESTAEHPAIEGLNILLARLRRLMREQGLERLDTEGLPFDADTMNAIGTVEAADYPSGHVAEQFSPAYLWKGQLLRFAEVRTAK